MRVAQFKVISLDHVVILDEDTSRYMSGYIRVSEWEEVKFKPCLKPRDVGAQMEYLDALEKKETEEFEGKRATYDERVKLLQKAKEDLAREAQ